MFRLIKTIALYIVWAVIFALFLPICLVLSFFPASFRYENRWYYWLTCLWCKALNSCAFVRMQVRGKEHLPVFPSQPAVIVMNHASGFDILLIESLLDSYPRIWLSKEEYGRLPIFGTLLRRMHVLVPRKKPRKALESLLHAYRIAQKGSRHLLIFPEGTRSVDGNLGPFHEGFAFLAEKLRRPVIPIALKGTYTLWPKGQLVPPAMRSTVELMVGNPLTKQEGESRTAFTARVRGWFLSRIPAR